MFPFTPRIGLISTCNTARIVLAMAGVTLALVPALPALASNAASDEIDGNQYVLDTKPTSVAVFKNGLGFFMREGEVNLDDGWCSAREIPPAVFGTLAIFSHDENETVDIVGAGDGHKIEFDDVDAASDEATKRERLTKLTNLQVRIAYMYNGLYQTDAGKLSSVEQRHVILESGSKPVAIPIATIRSVQYEGMPLRIHVSAEDGDTGGRSRLGIAYLRKGITWVPEYTIRIIDDETAELSLRGTLINEAEDIVHGDVHFVVGVPNFLHTEYLAPISVGQAIRAIGSATAPAFLQSQFSNSFVSLTNRDGADQFSEALGSSSNADLGNLPAFSETGGTDYTVYTKHDLTVRRGEKAIVTLFTRQIKYGHVYRWSPPERMRHFFTLQNDTPTAWTTGPALTISGKNPLSEQMLLYTPRGGQCEVEVTTAINVAHAKTETEDGRLLKAHEPYPHSFLDLVTLKGKLELKNFEDTETSIIIDAVVPGKPVDASDDGMLLINPLKLRLEDREGIVRWNLTLAPKEKKTIAYTYERYVPSR